ncbi:hypothetical protein EC950183_4012, partial [Escherichia coli 95.0183]
MSGSTSQLQ